MDSVPTGGTSGWQEKPGLFTPGFHIEGAKQQLMTAINARNVTDERLSNQWVILPILVYIISVAVLIIIQVLSISDIYERLLTDPYYEPTIDEIYAAIGPMIISGLIISAIAYSLFALLSYKLLRRHNEHFERESQLRMGILSFLRAVAGSPDKEYVISSEIATMNMLHNDANAKEPRRTPILWALVIGFMWVPLINIILMIMSIYMFYFLMKEIWEHDQRFHDFMAQTYSALYKLGYSFAPVSEVRRLERRSFALYFLLSIITLGFFVLYWWYVLVRDPNEHYAQQWTVENHLANVISQK